MWNYSKGSWKGVVVFGALLNLPDRVSQRREISGYRVPTFGFGSIPEKRKAPICAVAHEGNRLVI